MDFTKLIPLVLTALSAQELAFATTELTLVLTNENNRVKAGLTDSEINATVSGIVKLAFGEQNAAVAMLTSRAAPAPAKAA